MTFYKFFLLTFFVLTLLQRKTNFAVAGKPLPFEGFESDRNALKTVPPAYYDLYYDNLYHVPSLYSTILTSFKIGVSGDPRTIASATKIQDSTTLHGSGPSLCEGTNVEEHLYGKKDKKIYDKILNATLHPYGLLSAGQSTYNVAIFVPVEMERAQELGLATDTETALQKNVKETTRSKSSLNNSSMNEGSLPFWCETPQILHDERKEGKFSASLVAAAEVMHQLLERAEVPYFFFPADPVNISSSNNNSMETLRKRKGKLLYNLSLVLSPQEGWNSSLMPENNEGGNNLSSDSSVFFCVDCFRRAVSAYNTIHKCNEVEKRETGKSEGSSGAPLPYGCITSVFFRENNVGRCQSLPIHDLFSAFFNSSEARSTFSMQPISVSGEEEWYRLWFSAQFNQQKWKEWKGADTFISHLFLSQRVFPLFAIEYRPTEQYVIQVPPPATSPFSSDSPTSCFALSTPTVGVWLPAGGWTLWGRLFGANRIPDAWTKNKTAVYPSGKKPRHVVLLVPSTTLDGFGFAQVTKTPNATLEAIRHTKVAAGASEEPFFSTGGADVPVSGIVAALAIADGVRRYRMESPLGEGILLDIFFLPSEWTGGVGSASLFEMIQEKERIMFASRNERMKNNQKIHETGASFPTAKGSSSSVSHVFSVPTEVASADVVIALDQLAMNNSESPLFYHVNKKVNTASNTALREALDFLSAGSHHNNTRVFPSSTTSLPFSPISRYLEYFPSSATSAAIIAFSRYNASFINPHVFTPSDQPSDLVGPSAVAEAANVVLGLITKNATRIVDNDLVHHAWSCLTKRTISTCSHVLELSFENCSLRPRPLSCFLYTSSKEKNDEELFDEEVKKIGDPLLTAKEKWEQLLEAPVMKSSNSFHPYLSRSEQMLRRWMEAAGLQVIPLPALPPELEPTSSEVYCWRWKGKMRAPSSTSGSDEQDSLMETDVNNRVQDENVIHGVSVFGSVIFSLSGGARVTLVDGDPDVGWWMMVFAVVSCSLVFYFTRKMVL